MDLILLVIIVDSTAVNIG